MLSYIIRRLLQMIPVLFLVTMISFTLMFVLPGDPALAILGEDNLRNVELYNQLRAEMGLDRPIPIQYLDWVGHVATGDLGTSTRSKIPVTTLLGQRMGPTFELGLISLFLSIVIGVPTGIISAVKSNTKTDAILTVSALMAAAMPGFWLGLLLILCFGLWLRWLPPSGYIPPTEDLVANLKLMILPAMTMAGGGAAVLTRQTRSAMLEVLRQEYITTARSKGLLERVVINRHALKNAMIPVVTVIAMQVNILVGGAVIAESMFAIPGVGRLAADSIFTRDFPVLQAVVFIMALVVLSAMLITDIAYAWLDPRIRYS